MTDPFELSRFNEAVDRLKASLGEPRPVATDFEPYLPWNSPVVQPWWSGNLVTDEASLFLTDGRSILCESAYRGTRLLAKFRPVKVVLDGRTLVTPREVQALLDALQARYPVRGDVEIAAQSKSRARSGAPDALALRLPSGVWRWLLNDLHAVFAAPGYDRIAFGLPTRSRGDDVLPVHFYRGGDWAGLTFTYGCTKDYYGAGAPLAG